jgi:hypothetical protein
VTQTVDGQHGVSTPAAPPGHAPAAGPAYPEPGRFTLFMHRLWARSPVWLGPAAILACFGGAAAYVLAAEPVDSASDTTTCLLKLTTGLDCPGCGGTRALTALLRGDVAAALSHNLLAVVLLPLLLWGWAGWLAFRTGRRPTRPDVGTGLAWTIAVSVPVFAVLRNVPLPALAWLGSGA